MVKTCSPNKRLKGFLIIHSNYFTVDKKDYVSVKIPSQFNGKSAKTANSITAENTKHANKVPSSSVPDSVHKIIIHFTYAKKFHKIIQCKDIESLKEAVFQILSDKITTCKPTDIEYQFGSEWYLLEEAEALEDILTSSKLEIYIRATPQECNPQSNSKQTASSQSGSANQSAVSAVDEQCNDTASISNPHKAASHETAEEIRKKSILTDVVNVSIGHLQRSLAIMIKSIMARLYGTKDILKELSLLTQALNIERSKIKSSGRQGSKKIDEISNDITSIIETKCVLWESSQSSDWSSNDFEDWLDYFKKNCHARIKRP